MCNTMDTLSKKNKIFRFVVVCLIGELLNFLFALLAKTLTIPLFLDTVGSVAVVFYAGLLPGLIVAVCYNVLWILISTLVSHVPLYPWDMLYALCGMVIVLTTWLFARKKENFRISWLITTLFLVLIAFASAFASSFVGGMIESVNRFYFGNLAYDSILYHFVKAFLGENLGLVASCILARIPVTVVDRFVCTFAGFGIYLLANQKARAYAV